MLTISGLTYRVAGRTLLDNASAQINSGWKVGLVGRNGAGKSTLLDLIRGDLQADAGSLTLQNDVRLGFVAQEAPGGATTPHEAVLAADLERARLLAEAETAVDPERIGEIQMRLVDIDAPAAPARAATILAGLGFDHAAQHRPLASFSGGWRMRVALAAALFAEPDLLLLDEPTNHLDLEASLWLEGFLKRYRRTLLLVSHDRSFLDQVADHILALADRRLTLYSGGYDAYLRARREALARNQALAARQAAQREHLQAFIDRFRAKATKARQAQSRVKALARMEPIAAANEEPPIRFDFPQPEGLRPPLIVLDHVDAGYAPGAPVLRRLDLRLDPDDRIALLGANGNGKSTLAKLLAGRLEPLAGRIVRSSKLRCGFFAQHQIEDLDGARTPFDHMAALTPKAPPEAVRARLGRFQFGQDKAFVAVRDLSGGEKARLTLALVTHDAPPLLILDEPTNHLDMEAREALVAALNDFAGAVVLISHDWHLLSLVADRLWLVANGTAQPYDGDLEDYRRQVLSARPAGDGAQGGNGQGSGAGNGGQGNGQRRSDRRASADRRRELEPLRRQARQAEQRVSQLTQVKRDIDRQLADPATYSTRSGEVPELLRRQATLAQELGSAEGAWLAAEEALEQAND